MPDCPSGRDEASCSVDMMTSAAPDLFFNDFTTDGFFIFDQTSQSPLFNDLFAATTAPFLDFFATEGSFFDGKLKYNTLVLLFAIFMNVLLTTAC
jgi:hypothetical protein